MVQSKLIENKIFSISGERIILGDFDRQNYNFT